MSLLDLPRKRLRNLEPNMANAWVKDFEKVIVDNSDAYALYRAVIYAGSSNDVLNFGFLASDIKGNYQYPEIVFNTATNEMYYNRAAHRFDFRNVDEVRNAMRDLALKLISLNVPLSQIYMDMPGVNAIQRAFVREDPKSHGDYVLFLTSANMRANYIYVEALTDGVENEILVNEWINSSKDTSNGE